VITLKALITDTRFVVRGLNFPGQSLLSTNPSSHAWRSSPFDILVDFYGAPLNTAALKACFVVSFALCRRRSDRNNSNCIPIHLAQRSLLYAVDSEISCECEGNEGNLRYRSFIPFWCSRQSWRIGLPWTLERFTVCCRLAMLLSWEFEHLAGPRSWIWKDVIETAKTFNIVTATCSSKPTK